MLAVGAGGGAGTGAGSAVPPPPPPQAAMDTKAKKLKNDFFIDIFIC